MKKFTVLIAGLLLCGAITARAQTFSECADLNDDGSINVADMVVELAMFQGLNELPVGKGDVDFRAGYTLGDFRYLLGYLFQGYPIGGCPPFDLYVVATTDDTLFLPMTTVAPGSGSLVLPIVFVNHVAVTDLLLPVEIIGLSDSLVFDSLAMANPGFPAVIANDWSHISDGGLQISYMSTPMAPGRHVIANMYFHYSNFAGGPINVIPGSPNVNTFLNYVYGNAASGLYSDLDVGMPTVVFTDEFDVPSLVLDPDTLHFTAVLSGPNPAPQSFSILSTGASFSWSLTKTSWLDVDKTTGSSGESVQISPHTSGFTPGTYYGQVTVSTDGALNAPATLVVQVDVGFAAPPMDANCDGVYNLVDIIFQINYMFRGGPPPCNPCLGPVDSL